MLDARLNSLQPVLRYCDSFPSRRPVSKPRMGPKPSSHSEPSATGALSQTLPREEESCDPEERMCKVRPGLGQPRKRVERDTSVPPHQ